jgi:hypothetical protein
MRSLLLSIGSMYQANIYVESLFYIRPGQVHSLPHFSGTLSRLRFPYLLPARDVPRHARRPPAAVVRSPLCFPRQSRSLRLLPSCCSQCCAAADDRTCNSARPNPNTAAAAAASGPAPPPSTPTCSPHVALLCSISPSYSLVSFLQIGTTFSTDPRFLRTSKYLACCCRRRSV